MKIVLQIVQSFYKFIIFYIRKMPILKRRRTKNSRSKTTNKYRCHCGKAYFSYPALYLHAKLKHQQKISFKDNHKSANPEQKTARSSKRQSRSGNSDQNQQINNAQQLIFKSPNQHDGQGIIQKLEQSGLIPKNIQKILTLYLKEIFSEKTVKVYEDICLLFQVLKDCLNNTYQEFDPRYERDKLNYCAVADGKFIPQFLNYFVTSYISAFLSENPNYFHIDSIIYTDCLKTSLLEFTKWLNRKKFTKLLVILNN